MFFSPILDSNFPIDLFTFLGYRCSNSNDRASQVVICYEMTYQCIFHNLKYLFTFGPTGNWSKDYTSEVQVGPVQGPMVQVIWSKDYSYPLGSIPGLATYFRFSFPFFKKGSCQLLAKVCARSTG